MANGVVEAAQSYIYTIIVGVVILLVGFGLGILARKLMQKVLKEIELNKIMAKVGITHNLERGISIIISYLIYLVTIVYFLRQLGITSVVLYLVLGGILMLIILTSLVGLKDVIPNFVAWLILQKRGNIKVGKTVEVKEISGRVEKVGYLETEIKTYGGDILYVPNTLFLKSKFKIKKN
ncbi:MAG: mechanosensitive ion channel domain-containing protein [Nanoarchaeota archaeon]|nr:mechanosensitive ion channel family protein [Nanoarchaeota archaeon]MBU1632152.1 mechanosensitive ion channel family protein [Nanoarchaeota archaeon]MBU1876353.1 mechanosensitive ion channel family protein [Nanoarchaeota archaeon]